MMMRRRILYPPFLHLFCQDCCPDCGPDCGPDCSPDFSPQEYLGTYYFFRSDYIIFFQNMYTSYHWGTFLYLKIDVPNTAHVNKYCKNEFWNCIFATDSYACHSFHFFHLFALWWFEDPILLKVLWVIIGWMICHHVARHFLINFADLKLLVNCLLACQSGTLKIGTRSLCKIIFLTKVPDVWLWIHRWFEKTLTINWYGMLISLLAAILVESHLYQWYN